MPWSLLSINILSHHLLMGTSSWDNFMAHTLNGDISLHPSVCYMSCHDQKSRNGLHWTRTTTSKLAAHLKELILTCRPDTSGAVPGAFVILLAQDAESAWTFAVRQVPLWLGRLVQVSGTSCKLHYFTQCRSDLTHLCVVAPAHLLYHAHFSIKSWLRKV